MFRFVILFLVSKVILYKFYLQCIKTKQAYLQ